jgi:hypothetical protein
VKLYEWPVSSFSSPTNAAEQFLAELLTTKPPAMAVPASVKGFASARICIDLNIHIRPSLAF